MRMLGILVATLVAACTHPIELQPAPGARSLTGHQRAAVSSVAGVVVAADAADFPSRVPIEREVTPVHVRVENRSLVPVRIRYADFALHGSDGRRYAAIAPFDVDGRITVSSNRLVFENDYGWDGYQPYPWYAGTWGLAPSPYGGYSAYPYDPFYYDNSAVLYETVDLPTPSMIRSAMPEGRLRPGGVVSGWLYFQELPDDLDAATFTADIVQSDTNTELGEVVIPFVAG